MATLGLLVRTRLTLVIEVEHGIDYDPSSHLVWYFSDDEEPPEHTVVTEEWEDINV